eukprot:6185568-Pleurochrysis_carterae.AAC.1
MSQKACLSRAQIRRDSPQRADGSVSEFQQCAFVLWLSEATPMRMDVASEAVGDLCSWQAEIVCGLSALRELRPTRCAACCRASEFSHCASRRVAQRG